MVGKCSFMIRTQSRLMATSLFMKEAQGISLIFALTLIDYRVSHPEHFYWSNRAFAIAY
jgi:hypothetical protein